MSILHLLFGFSGRISRKTYIIAVTLISLVTTGLLFAGVAAVAGKSYFSALWGGEPEDLVKVGLIYAVVMLVSLWPTLAIVTKRLHDRNYPMWVALGFYASILLLTVPVFWSGPMTFDNVEQTAALKGYTVVFVLLSIPISFWFAAQLMFMRGVVGSNAWGADPLEGRPLTGYERRTFWNVVFNPDGRMRRGMWWLMCGSLLVLFVVWAVLYGGAIQFAVSSLPPDASPEWRQSAEGQEAIMQAIWPVALPMTLLIYPLIWVAFAAGTKRLHDRGRSGWVLASYYVPFALMMIAGVLAQGEAAELMRWLMIAAGVIFAGLTLWLLVELGFLKGQAGANAYGPGTISETSTV